MSIDMRSVRRSPRLGPMVTAIILTAALVASGGAQRSQASEAVMTDHPAYVDGNCGWAAAGELKVIPDLDARVRAYVPTTLDPALGHLDAGEQAVLGKLVEVARIMDALFGVQATPCATELAAHIAALPADRQDAARRYFAINKGPWDRRFHYEPFMGEWPHPAGANYYPTDLTDAEKARIADHANGLDGLFTMVRRDASGGLVAVPYSRYFAAELGRAASLMREAAALTGNASLKAFLESRAAAFLSDDYYESDLLWMDLDSTVEITVGPYETYEDGLFGYKAAFEAFVTVTDPVESQRLAKFKDELPWLESQIPMDDRHKNPNRGSESPIRVVDEVYSAGDTRAGVQTIAFNLPNDERVREAKGSKKVLLRNVMKAKFDQILVPIAQVVVADDQLGDLTAESFFLHTLWHEMSHGLGPGNIKVDGRDTEVRLELKDTYSTMEEAKADAMGEWDIFMLTRAGRGYFPEAIFRQQSATYLAGIFRSVRFGIGEAHGKANAIQFNYLVEKGAILHDAQTGKFRMNVAVFEQAISDLVGEICTIQAEGDYAASQAFIQRYGGMPEVLAGALAKLDHIPVDIAPVFPRWDNR
ncbi:MAG: peptidase [bacterium]|nr:peptidase [bacterium]